MAAQAMIRPTRLVAPPQGRAQLELVHWPLYSAIALATATILPRQTSFFTYALGGTVSGAGAGAIAATQFHTNLETPNFLAAPKTFTVTAVRLHMPFLQYAASPTVLATSGVAIASDLLADDLQLIIGSTHFRFSVGPKDYVRGPTYAIPANYGIGGVAGTSVSNTNAASVFQRRTALHTSGREFRMDTYPVLIANQQTFAAELLCEWTTNPTLAAGGRLLFCILDGIMGREVS
jgi:hypothetical protein